MRKSKGNTYQRIINVPPSSHQFACQSRNLPICAQRAPLSSSWHWHRGVVLFPTMQHMVVCRPGCEACSAGYVPRLGSSQDTRSRIKRSLWAHASDRCVLLFDGLRSKIKDGTIRVSLRLSLHESIVASSKLFSASFPALGRFPLYRIPMY